MNESERSSLVMMRDRWIAGGTAEVLAPDAWKEITADQTDQHERFLLAIAGQGFDVAFRPAAPGTLSICAPLPVLALPTLPESMRPVLRAALKQAGAARGMSHVAAFVASRGFAPHPLDWMPAASDLDAPAVYAPWVDWQSDRAKSGSSAREQLDAETWGSFPPAVLRAHLSEMRRSDPAGALALMEAKAAEESAETRLALLALLDNGLSAADAPFLASLVGDKSSKVRQLAMRLLARIGRRDTGVEGDAAVTELAGLIEQSRAGVIRRRTVYGPMKLKSMAQQQHRTTLFELCQLIDLAAKFGVSENEFIAGWQFGIEESVDLAFARMVAASANDQIVSQLADMLIVDAAVAPLAALGPRLDEARRRSFVRTVLAGEPRFLALLDPSIAIELCGLDRDEIMASKAYRQVRGAIEAGNGPGVAPVAAHCFIFGFLASAAAAQSILADLALAGLGPADTALGLLRLNAALAGTSSPQILN